MSEGTTMLTEKEAGTKLCPYSFAVQEVRGPDGAGIREGGPWLCIASACMAWRVVEPERDDYETIHPVRLAHETNPPFSNCPEGFDVFSYGTGNDYSARRKIGTKPATGYCGLAGRSNE